MGRLLAPAAFPRDQRGEGKLFRLLVKSHLEAILDKVLQGSAHTVAQHGNCRRGPCRPADEQFLSREFPAHAGHAAFEHADGRHSEGLQVEGSGGV